MSGEELEFTQEEGPDIEFERERMAGLDFLLWLVIIIVAAALGVVVGFFLLLLIIGLLL